MHNYLEISPIKSASSHKTKLWVVMLKYYCSIDLWISPFYLLPQNKKLHVAKWEGGEAFSTWQLFPHVT